MIHSSQSFLFVATLLVAPPSFPSHDNFHRREGLLEENEREEERERLGPVRPKNNAPQPLEYKMPRDRCTIRRCPLEKE